MAIENVENEEKLEMILKSDLAIIFKHSKICPVSGIALEEMQIFAGKHPDIPVYLVDVLAHRPLSQKTSAYYGIRHESPQVIIIQSGAAGWNASHYAITAAKVAAALPPSP